jgi:hypothetical protein
MIDGRQPVAHLYPPDWQVATISHEDRVYRLNELQLSRRSPRKARLSRLVLRARADARAALIRCDARPAGGRLALSGFPDRIRIHLPDESVRSSIIAML